MEDKPLLDQVRRVVSSRPRRARRRSAPSAAARARANPPLLPPPAPKTPPGATPPPPPLPPPQLAEAHDEVVRQVLGPVKAAWQEMLRERPWEAVLGFIHAVDWKVRRRRGLAAQLSCYNTELDCSLLLPRSASEGAAQAASQPS